MANTKKKYTSQDFIDAIKGGKEYSDPQTGQKKKLPSSGGIISTICQRVGCDWHTAKEYITKDPDVKQAYEDEIERVKDLCESTLLNSIIGGDTNDAKWWLARKAKERGFNDTFEAEVKGEVVIRVVRDRVKE